jgi:hypothetical protein
LQTTTGHRCRSAAIAYPTEFFAGLIDEVRVYNRALSAAEIQSDMAIAVSGPRPACGRYTSRLARPAR